MPSANNAVKTQGLGFGVSREFNLQVYKLVRVSNLGLVIEGSLFSMCKTQGLGDAWNLSCIRNYLHVVIINVNSNVIT